MALRAVLLDYGMVLTEPPSPAARMAIKNLTGLAEDRLEPLYWAYRSDFDLGNLTGEGFWRKLAADAGILLSQDTFDALVRYDARMWMEINQRMVAWQLALKEHGLLTGIVSNMGDTILAAMERDLPWLNRFDVLVWSYRLRIAKPDPAIYRYALGQLGVAPDEVLFIDDRGENVDAAVASGMKGLVFTTVEQLRDELIAQGYDKELPLPADQV